MVTKHSSRILIMLLSLAVHLAWPESTLAKAKISVQLDRTIVEEGESFTVQFISEGDLDDDPNFLGLEKDFRILSRRQSSNIQFINGRLSSEKQWTLMLMPKRPGKLKIPSIPFGKDKSPAKTLTVRKASKTAGKKGDGLIFIEAEATPKTAFIQSQVIFTVRIYHAVSLVNASLSSLHINDNSAIIEKLGDDISYEKRIKGSRYKVFEKRFAIFPQKSGKLEIDPIEFEGQYVKRGRMLQSKFLRTNAITINVKPQPTVQSAGPDDVWLPATNIQISDKWSQDPLESKVGEPVTRTITISAAGLMGSQLPEIKMPGLDNVKQYPDQAQVTTRKTKNGVIGIRQEKIAFIPTKSGKYHLPEIQIPWWNTKKDRQEIAKIQAYEIEVDHSLESAQVGSGLQPPIASTNEGNAVDPAAVVTSQPTMGYTDNAWFWISVSLLSLWLVTLFMWWKQKNNKDKGSALGFSKEEQQWQKALERKIKHACNLDDAEQVKQLLLRWGAVYWKDDKPTSLGEFANRCVPLLAQRVRALAKTLYGNQDSQAWNGPEFWQVFAEHNPSKNDEAESEGSGRVIQPLFQHSA